MVGTTIALAYGAKGHHRHLYYGVALTFWAAFPLLLRPCEMAAFGRSTLHLSTDFGQEAFRTTAVATDAKTKRCFGTTQMAHHEDVRLCNWPACIFRKASASKHGKLFNGTLIELTLIFRMILKLLEVDVQSLTLGGFQAGGATHHFIKQQNFGLLQFQGRWKNAQTPLLLCAMWYGSPRSCKTDAPVDDQCPRCSTIIPLLWVATVKPLLNATVINTRTRRGQRNASHTT